MEKRVYSLEIVRKWPGSKEEVLLTLKNCVNYNSLESFFNHKKISKTLISDTENWTFSEFVCSALNYKLNEAKLSHNSELSSYFWSLITPLLMNSLISGDIGYILSTNSLCRKKEDQARLKGTIYSLTKSSPPFFDTNCITNIVRLNRVGNYEDLQKVIQHFNVEKDPLIVSTYLSSFLGLPAHHISPSRRFNRSSVGRMEMVINEKPKSAAHLQANLDPVLANRYQYRRYQYLNMQQFEEPPSQGLKNLLKLIFKSLPILVMGYVVPKILPPSSPLKITPPPPAVMVIEIPQLSMIPIPFAGLRRSFSASFISHQADSPRHVLSSSTRTAVSHNGDFPAMSSDSDSEGIQGSQASQPSVEGSQSGSLSSGNSSDFSGSDSPKNSGTPIKEAQFVASSIKLPNSTNPEKNESFTEAALSSFNNSYSSEESRVNEGLEEEMPSGSSSFVKQEEEIQSDSFSFVKQEEENATQEFANTCKEFINRIGRSPKGEDGTSSTNEITIKVRNQDRKLVNRIDHSAFKSLQKITAVVENHSLLKGQGIVDIENPIDFYTTLHNPHGAPQCEDEPGFRSQNEIPRTPIAAQGEDESGFHPQNEIPRTPTAAKVSSSQPTFADDSQELAESPAAAEESTRAQEMVLEETVTESSAAAEEKKRAQEMVLEETVTESSAAAEEKKRAQDKIIREKQHRARITQDKRR